MRDFAYLCNLNIENIKTHINMSNKFVEHKGFNLVETNKEILDKWMKLDVFHKSIDEREGCPQFIFF